MEIINLSQKHLYIKNVSIKKKITFEKKIVQI